MNRTISVLLLIFMMLSLAACAEAESENPYRLIAQSVVSYHPEESEHSTYTYSYNEHGFLSREEDSLGNTKDFLYDNYGNIIQTTVHGADGSENVFHFELTLDDHHRILRSENWHNGELNDIQEYVYDSNGREIQYSIQRFGPGEDISSVHSKEYDHKGNLIRSQFRRQDGYEGYTEYQYQNGKCISKNFYDADGTLTWRRDFSYDDSGLIETMVEYKPDLSPDLKSVSTYDEYGNILRFEVYHYLKDQPEPVLARIIAYTYEEIPK